MIPALALPKIGLGGNVFGHFCDERETRNILDVALDSGLNFVDTSDSYSEGRSEEFIGSATHAARSRWIIATKAGTRSDEPPNGLGRSSRIRQKLESSLKRLRTEWIDLYQMHHFDPDTPLEETLGTLADLRAQGKIRHIGVTNYSAEQITHILDASARHGFHRIDTVQNPLNILRRGGERDWLPVCQHAGIGVLLYGVLARGLLSEKYLRDEKIPANSRAAASESVRADLDTEVLEAVEALSRLAQSKSMGIRDLAIGWALSRPGVTTLILGIRSTSQLREHIRTMQTAFDIPDSARIDAVLGPPDRFNRFNLGAGRPTR